MVFDKNKKITKEEYREELVKEIKGVDEARDYICKNFSRPFDAMLSIANLAKFAWITSRSCITLTIRKNRC